MVEGTPEQAIVNAVLTGVLTGRTRYRSNHVMRALPTSVAQISDPVLGRDFAVGRVGMGRGNAIAIFPHTVEMEFDCLSHGLLDFLSGRAGCHATGKIRRKCGVSGFCLFNYDKILVHFGALRTSFHTSLVMLFPATIHRALSWTNTLAAWR